MSLFDRVAHFILRLLFRHRDVVIGGKLYLRRYYLCGLGTDSQWFLHNIRLPDEGRDLHDHPWDFATTILKGWYIEETSRDAVVLVLGDHRSYPAEHSHRVAVVSSAWTLVHAGRARRAWGFWSDGNWISALDRLGADAVQEEDHVPTSV